MEQSNKFAPSDGGPTVSDSGQPLKSFSVVGCVAKFDSSSSSDVSFIREYTCMDMHNDRQLDRQISRSCKII